MDLYTEVTNSILQSMESGTDQWVAPWTGKDAMPTNKASGKPYTGINTLILWGAALRHGYTSDQWLTFKQADALGAHVRKGEHGEKCVFFKPYVRESVNASGEKETKRAAVMKGFTVFNICQIEGLPAVEPETVRPVFSPLQQAESVLIASGASIQYGGNHAYYRPSTDTIHLPEREKFISAEGYYGTALHELTHWTGHKSRLAREYGQRFGDNAYAFEELIAELGSAFLSADLGLIKGTLENHASYLASWIKILKGDSKAIWTASAAAAKAHAFIMAKGATEQVEDEQEAA
ncbi:MAG: ArdC family protein [Acidiferrobacteraceae bacterium]